MRRYRRRSMTEDSHGRERWLVSYADFITLLFAFFVVMYSVSSVNEGKYKVLSETLEGVFNVQARAPEPIPVGMQQPAVQPAVEAALPGLAPVAGPPTAPTAIDQRQGETLRQIADDLAENFDALVSQGVVTVDRNEEWVALSLRDSLLFSSGRAEPHYDAFPIVEKIADILRKHDNAVVVEGFTDNQPISSSRFMSNWELSTARAAAVVRLLVSEGLDPRTLAAVGYGEFQPIARNDTAEGRKRNRRVVLLISKDNTVRGSIH